jgi:TIR domain/SIR2-like domain
MAAAKGTASASSPLGDTERLWDQLLLLIEEGQVVPVVGPDLLEVPLAGRRVQLYSYLAERLAAFLDVGPSDGPDPPSLNDVVCRHLARGGDLEDVYPALKRVTPPVDAVPLPAPLLQLAAISPFTLFVTTTFDSLLEHALDRVRFGGQTRTRVVAYSTQRPADLPAEALPGGVPVVFHLLGRLSAVPEYSVTEEDTLEFIHALQSDARQPRRFLDEIARRHVLLIGNGFSDWLARFFLRIVKGGRLWTARGKTDFVVDPVAWRDPQLIAFLRHFAPRTRMFPVDSAPAFVAELHGRWTAAHPEPAAPAPTRPPTSATDEVPSGAVFLSYASEDRGEVEALREALESAGMDAWFDRRDLEPGDEWEAKIRRSIASCSLFVPLISRHVLTRGRRYFRVEWRLAEEIARQVAPSQRFIVPVALDDAEPGHPDILDAFRKTQWLRRGRGPIAELVDPLRALYRDAQRASAGVA